MLDVYITTCIIIGIFVTVGCVLPAIMILKDRMDNRLVLWISIAFALCLIFGAMANFDKISDEVRSEIIQYSFISIIVFGVFFGIDLLLKNKCLYKIEYKDFKIQSKDVKQDVEQDVEQDSKRQQ